MDCSVCELYRLNHGSCDGCDSSCIDYGYKHFRLNVTEEPYRSVLVGMYNKRHEEVNREIERVVPVDFHFVGVKGTKECETCNGKGWVGMEVKE